jgi:hypothetical protein
VFIIASLSTCSMLIELVFNAGAMRKETLYVKFAIRSVKFSKLHTIDTCIVLVLFSCLLQK